VEAFELGVVDYVRKPVQAERLAESLRRITAARLVPAHPAVAGRRERAEDPTIPVELAGVTRLLPRSAVRWVEAQGDYARLHPAAGMLMSTTLRHSPACPVGEAPVCGRIVVPIR